MRLGTRRKKQRKRQNGKHCIDWAPQIAFFPFFRFGYEMLLLIEFFCWIGLDLIRFCFGFLESLSKRFFFFFPFLNMIQSFKRLDFGLGLHFWSSTTHLRLHQTTTSTYAQQFDSPSFIFFSKNLNPMHQTSNPLLPPSTLTKLSFSSVLSELLALWV